MNPEQINELSVKMLGSGLSAEEQEQWNSWVQASAENRTRWTEEHGINELLAQLPKVPLSSNFTSQVLQAIRQEQQPRKQSRGDQWIAAAKRIWFRPLAAAATLGVVAFFVVRQQSQLAHKESVSNLQLISGIATAFRTSTDIPAAPRIELLEDFEAIRQLGTPIIEPDLTLLAVLQ